MLAHEGGGVLFDLGLFGDDLCLGRIHVGLQVLGIEPGEHLPGRNPVTDIHGTLDDLPADTERQLGLHPGLDIAGQRDVDGVVGQLDLLHENPWPVLLDRFLFVAST
ncbi:hypothetical protein D3C80_1773570 [compost metagenome]